MTEKLPQYSGRPIMTQHNRRDFTNPTPTDLHHELAYKRLTGCIEAAEQEDSNSTSVVYEDIQHEDAEHHEGSVAPLEHLDKSEFQCSFSTLPSTTSKLALKPPPLRLTKDEQHVPSPPIPIRSKLRNAHLAEEETIDVSKNESNYPVVAATRRSSYATISVYSTDSNDFQPRLTDTPPSSPPDMPQCLQDRFSVAIIDPSTCAENLRSELGIIDDTFDMYADCDKHFKHEAALKLVPSQIRSSEELARTRTMKMSRAQMRLRKERARQDAIGKLEEPRIDVEIPQSEFAKWVNDALRMEANGKHANSTPPNVYIMVPSAPARWEHTVLVNDTSRHAIRARSPAQCTTSKESIVELVTVSRNSILTDAFDLEKYEVPEFTTDGVSSASTLEDGDANRPSLTLLQNQLIALMHDRRKSHQSQDRTVGEGATSDAEDSPTNLQKIDIEWKGKRYPVLIGDGGRIWEGPCVDPHCEEHGETRKELVFGRI